MADRLQPLKRFADLSMGCRKLMLALDRHGKSWTIKRVLAGEINIKPRDIAALASEADGMIISTTHGLRLAQHSSDELMKDSYNDLANKAQSTGHHATTIMRRYQIRLKYRASGCDLRPDIPATPHEVSPPPDPAESITREPLAKPKHIEQDLFR